MIPALITACGRVTLGSRCMNWRLTLQVRTLPWAVLNTACTNQLVQLAVLHVLTRQCRCFSLFYTQPCSCITCTHLPVQLFQYTQPCKFMVGTYLSVQQEVVFLQTFLFPSVTLAAVNSRECVVLPFIPWITFIPSYRTTVPFSMHKHRYSLWLAVVGVTDLE